MLPDVRNPPSHLRSACKGGGAATAFPFIVSGRQDLLFSFLIPVRRWQEGVVVTVLHGGDGGRLTSYCHAPIAAALARSGRSGRFSGELSKNPSGFDSFFSVPCWMNSFVIDPLLHVYFSTRSGRMLVARGGRSAVGIIPAGRRPSRRRSAAAEGRVMVFIDGARLLMLF
jgi:hypothetical protein